MTLTPLTEQFILHWGEMGTKWGINRTVAQMHALLYLSEQPLTAEDITDLLGVARSNVSTSLRELQGWGVIKVVHRMGDRRDHFEALKDVWEMFQTIVHERKRREVDPTFETIKSCLEQAQKAGKSEAYTKERLEALYEFFASANEWHAQVCDLPPSTIKKFLKWGGKIRKLLTAGSG